MGAPLLKKTTFAFTPWEYGVNVARGKRSTVCRSQSSVRILKTLPWTRPATVVLVSTPRLLHPVETFVSRGPQNIREERKPDVHAPTLGLSSFVLSPDDADTLEIVTRRPSALPPTVAVPIRIEILRADRDLAEATLVTKDFEAAADGKRRRFVLNGNGLVEKN